MEKLIAYHGKQSIKDNIIARLRAHYKADEIIKGTYWENGKGCAVGCTIHSNDHGEYEPRFGIPRVLARLEDGIFEGLPSESAKEWPIKFMSAIEPGVDLSLVWPRFAVFLLVDKKHGVIQYAKTSEQKSAIEKVANLYSGNREISVQEWRDARRAADAAAYAAYAADADAAAAYAAYAADAAAAYAAYAADADAAAAYAAYAADAAAAYAAAAYAAAADAAADAAAYADAAATYADARKKHRIAQAEKLLELLRECTIGIPDEK